MENKVGYPISDRKEINELVFGENGLIKAVDVDTYNVRLERIKRLITSKDENVRGKQFLPYFVNKWVPTLHDFVIKPSLIGKVSTGWTNNNCESANHILKTATQWKLMDLSKFIAKVEQIVEGEKMERCRAVRGTGNFRLTEQFKHHQVSIDHWEMLTEEQRERKIKNSYVTTGGLTQM